MLILILLPVLEPWMLTNHEETESEQPVRWNLNWSVIGRVLYLPGALTLECTEQPLPVFSNSIVSCHAAYTCYFRVYVWFSRSSQLGLFKLRIAVFVLINWILLLKAILSTCFPVLPLQLSSLHILPFIWQIRFYVYFNFLYPRATY